MPAIAKNGKIYSKTVNIVMGGPSSESSDKYDKNREEPYHLGELTIYNDKLYICIVESTSGIFNPEHWRKTSLVELMSVLLRNLSTEDLDL